jgi:anti-sigma-K factor RskA
VAAVVAVAVVGVAALVGDRGDRGRTVASVTLSSEGLTGAPAAARGQAIIRERDGQRVLRLDLEGVSARSGEYLELWLIDTNVKGMVSLGLAENGHDYVLPAGLALGEYPVVDVSTEPYDGDPAHSGSSLVRGLLPV